MAIAKRKKRFFEVNMPIIKRQTQLQAFEEKELVGRNIIYDLTRMNRGKGMLIKLKVKIEKEELTSIPTEIKLMPFYLRRMVRKGTNYVEDSFSAECKDSIIRIKPFLITRRKVSRRVRKALRNKAREELINYVKSKNSKDLFEEILRNQIQKPLSLKLKKIYPLSLCEIRILKVEKFLEKTEKKKEKKEAEEVKEKVNEEKKEVKENLEKVKTKEDKEVEDKKGKDNSKK